MDYLIKDVIDESFKNVKRVWVDDNDFLLNALNDPSFENAVVGSQSLFNVKTRTSYVFKGSNSLDLPITRQAIARKIIERSLKENGIKGYPYRNRPKKFEFLAPPLYCKPYDGWGIYFDLKAAYYQIFSKLPLVLGQVGTSYLCSPPWFYPFLARDLYSDKLIRNSIPGVWRSQTTTRIKSGKLVRSINTFPTSNFIHWNFICGLLHWIATVAVTHGAIYVHTDGYIFPENSEYPQFLDYLESQGLIWQLKLQGTCSVYSIGSYAFQAYYTAKRNKVKAIDKVIDLSYFKDSWNKLKKVNPYWEASNNALL